MYLIQEPIEVIKHRDSFMKPHLDKIDQMIAEGEFTQLQAYEDELLHELNLLKLRIDLLISEDQNKEREIYETRLDLSAINLILWHIIKKNPNSELGKTVET